MNNPIILDNTLFNKLPYDVIEYIWSFNYDASSRIIQYYTKKFIRNKMNIITEMMGFAFIKCNLGFNAREYSLFYRNRILSREDILKTTNACKCCKIHSLNKPKILAPWVDTPFNGNQYKSCKCSCRQISRFICRGVE
jgi:hypothetical protein